MVGFRLCWVGTDEWRMGLATALVTTLYDELERRADVVDAVAMATVDTQSSEGLARLSSGRGVGSERR
jgi:hypothetical protein